MWTRLYFAPGIPGIISKNIDVENEQVNGKLCKMVSLSWAPEVKDDTIDKLRKGTLRPKSDGEGYRVPPPYSINVETKSRTRQRTVIPIVALNSGSEKGSNSFKAPDGRTLLTKHHHIDLGFCFTDYKVQGITVEKGDKLIVVLNNLPAHIVLATISVCLSRVTRIEDLQSSP